MKHLNQSLSIWKICGRGVLILLLPLLLCQCLFTRSKNPPPQFRGLTDKEAGRLAQVNDSNSRSDRSSNPDKDLSLEELAGQAELFLQNQEYEGSLENYARILGQDPNRHDIRYKMGVVLLLLGQLDDAKKELAEVLAHQVDNYQAHEAFGQVLLQQKNLGEAQQEFQTVLAADPNRFYSRYLLGVAYLQGNQLPQALAELKKAHTLNSSNPRVMADLGWTSYKMKNYEEASRWLKQAAHLCPNDPKVNFYLGMTLAALKKYPEALQAFLKSGDPAQGYNNIGVHYFADGHYAEAAQYFQKAVELRKTYYQEAGANLEKALKRLQEQPPEASRL